MQNPPPNPPNYGGPYNRPPNAPQSTPPGGKTSLGIDANVAAMLCYLTMVVCGAGLIVSLIFFLVEKTSRFVRFHAMQALLLLAAGIICSIAITILGAILSYAHLGFIAYILRLAIGLAFLVIWVFMAIKAFQGQQFKLPVIGDLAENIAR